MTHNSILLVIVLTAVVGADDATSVKVGETEIRLPNPPGMVELPKGDAYQPMFDVMIPPGSAALKESLTAEMLQDRDKVSSEPAFMAATIAPAVAITRNEDDAAFQKLVQKLEQKYSNGTTLNDSDAPHYADIKKKIAEASQKYGESVTANQGASCLGPISKGKDFISLLFTRNYTIHPKDKDIAQQCYLTLTYLHVKQKLLLIMIVRSNATLADKDLETVKDTTEKYVGNILGLNKAATP
jgi:hypothetical protein